MSTPLWATHAAGTLQVRDPGIPALKKWLVASILAEEFINRTEMPLAKGRTRPLNQVLEGQVLLLQAAEYFQAWIQCYAVYMALLSILRECLPS